MLARLAASLRARRGGVAGDDGEEATISLNDNCRVGRRLGIVNGLDLDTKV